MSAINTFNTCLWRKQQLHQQCHRDLNMQREVGLGVCVCSKRGYWTKQKLYLTNTDSDLLILGVRFERAIEFRMARSDPSPLHL